MIFRSDPMKTTPLQTLLAASAILAPDDDEPTCRSCGCNADLVHDDGELVCCDCMFEEETHEINQP